MRKRETERTNVGQDKFLVDCLEISSILSRSSTNTLIIALNAPIKSRLFFRKLFH